MILAPNHQLWYLELSRNKHTIGYVPMILKDIHGIEIWKLFCQYGLLTLPQLVMESIGHEMVLQPYIIY